MFFHIRIASRARGVSMVTALQGLCSYSPLSSNLVCTQSLPTTIKADGVADTAHKIRASALPLSRAARAVRPNERAPLRGRAESPGGEPDAAASTPVGQRSRAEGGRGGPALRGGGYNAAPEPEALCAIEGECRH